MPEARCLSKFAEMEREVEDQYRPRILQELQQRVQGLAETTRARPPKSADPSWHATLEFDRPAGDRMSLHGEMDDHRVDMQLHLVDINRFLLVNRGFYWIQERVFNR